MYLKTLFISLFFLILNKTNSKQQLYKYRLDKIIFLNEQLERKKTKPSHIEIFHKCHHDEEFHVEEDLAILNTEPIIFIAELKYALSRQKPNVDGIKELIRENIQFINFIDPQENTALSLAIEANNADIVEFLLENGAKIIEKNKSLLIKSLITIDWSKSNSYQPGIKIIILLLNSGANPNFKEHYDISNSLFTWTPLRIIINIFEQDADNNLPHIIRLLIEHGANVNQRYQPTNTTLLADAIAISKCLNKKTLSKDQLKKTIKIKRIVRRLKQSGATK